MSEDSKGKEPTQVGKNFRALLSERRARGEKIFPHDVQEEMWKEAYKKAGKESGKETPEESLNTHIGIFSNEDIAKMQENVSNSGVTIEVLAKEGEEYRQRVMPGEKTDEIKTYTVPKGNSYIRITRPEGSSFDFYRDARVDKIAGAMYAAVKVKVAPTPTTPIQGIAKAMDRLGQVTEKAFYKMGDTPINVVDKIDKLVDRKTQPPKHKVWNAVDKAGNVMVNVIDKIPSRKSPTTTRKSF